jgi:hypothetical protein
MATTGINGSQGRSVQKISGSRYIEESDHEEDCLYLHEENRIKAMDVSGNDYAFFANCSRRAQDSELREGFGQDIGRVRDTGSDSDSVASCHESAYFAAARGKVKDDSDNDDVDESVATDDDSDQEVTQVDDQSRPCKTARDVTELTTYRRYRNNSSSDDTRTPPSPIVSGNYKFQIGSSQNVFRRTRAGGRRPLRSAHGNAKVSTTSATLSTILLGQLRLTVTTGEIITYMRET